MPALRTPLYLCKGLVMLSNTVALDFGRALFGTLGAVVFSVMVAVSSFGAMTGEPPPFFSLRNLKCGA